MKYIDIDLLRKDIDNWKEAMADAVGEYSDGVRFALEHFTFVLDSLQQEQPSLPDNLEEAAEKFARFYDNGTCDGIAQDCFIFGAEWAMQQLKVE